MRGSSFLPLNNRTFPGQPDFYWVGLTDFLDEREHNKTGWRWSDGAFDPPSSALAWGPDPWTEPDDCICQLKVLYDNQIMVANCHTPITPMCQPKSLPSSASRSVKFQIDFVYIGLPAEYFAQSGGCSKNLTDVSSEIECARICMSEPMETCVAIYFNEASKECRLVLSTQMPRSTWGMLGAGRSSSSSSDVT